MKIYFKAASVLMLCVAFVHVKAQNYHTNQGTVLKEVKPADVDGSPFLNDEWQTATAITEKNTYNSLKAKYDLYKDQLVVANAKNEPMLIDEPVKKFTIANVTYASGFPPVGANNRSSFYMVLSGGKVKLLKHLGKIIQENKSYGAATVMREFRNTTAYYILRNDQMKSIKPDKKEITAALSDKAEQISTYLSSHKVNFKNDLDLAALFDYYNTL